MWSLLLPATFGLVLALLTTVLGRRLHPDVAAPVLAAVTALVAASVLAGMTLVAVAFLAASPSLAGVLGWCRDVLPHDGVPTALGVSAVGGLAVSLTSIVLTERTRRLARRWPRTVLHDGVEVFDSDDAVAFALPGRPGRVVVSTGMLRRLTHSQQAALVAHERAHLAGRHHRYLTAATIAAAAVPVLRPLARRVRHATERSADEAAAREVGSRRTVADAIARAALGPGARLRGAAAMAEVGVAARVAALLSPAPTPRRRAITAVTGASVVFLGLVGAVIQLHHTGSFAAHLCPPGWAS